METNSNSLLDFQANWEKLVDKAFGDYGSLTAEERIWFNLQNLIASVDNGGLISHYYNSGADRNKETIEDLHSIGFPEVANLLTQINAWLPCGQVSTDIDERNNVISDWQEGEYDELLDNFDKEFYERETELENTLIKHIKTKVLTV